ncbi:MAG TPA: hypothetical protein PLD88_12680, partial [Candidatus Berkiella sp.]|nr:hypothetical protein [Candidatus Berkiella sp.]
MPIDGPKSKNSKLKSGIRYNENFAKTWESRNISADDPNSGIKKCLRRVDTYVGIANSDPTAFWFHMAAEPVKHSCG